MLLHARKKFLHDDRMLQLMLLLSLLRSDPNSLLFQPNDAFLDNLPQDLFLGSSVGHISPSPFHMTDVHPKNFDRSLASYQQSVIEDLNMLGRYTSPSRPHHQEVQLYLLSGSQVSNNPDHQVGGPTPPPSPHEDHLSNDLSPEDLALIEALWKQDVDMGVGIPKDLWEDEQDFEFDGQTKDKDHGKKPDGETKLKEKDADSWMHLNFTIDSETGEHLLSHDSPISGGDVALETIDPRSPVVSEFPLTESVSELDLEFNLDEALKLVGLNCSETGETIWKGADSLESSFNELNQLVFDDDDKDNDDNEESEKEDDDSMTASQFHSQHPRSFQGRLGSLVRSGEMERWQEVVQYLGLPSPHHHTQAPHTPMATHTASPNHTTHGHHPPGALHHPQALYPTAEAHPPTTPTPPVPRGVLINNATLPPPMTVDPMTHHNITYTNSMGASSHLVTSSMNLTNSSELAGTNDPAHFKMENNSPLPPSEMMYYQNTNSEMNQTTDGLLSSILNDEALGLMEIAMNDSGCVLSQLDSEERGMDASSDSAVSSLGPDEPWGTTDPTTPDTDNGSRNQSDYNNTGANYRYGPEDPHRMPPVPLKKQHMFGRDKRFFHDTLSHGGPNNVVSGSTSGMGGDVTGYGGHYQPAPGIPSMEGATALDPEMKYSCTMDFRSHGEVSAAVDHVQHNHTYHMSPEGSSGLSRPTVRDKQKHRREHDRSLTRDEKRARAMNLPITCEDIINLPMDEFNERISKYDLTEAQLSLIRDIRRRGKNKVAAQNCRKRKLDQIIHLADEVKAIQNKKNELCNEYEYLISERNRIKHKFSLLYRHIFQSLRDPEGNPYSPHEYSLQQSADGSILLVPRCSMDPGSSNKPRGKDDGEQ